MGGDHRLHKRSGEVRWIRKNGNKRRVMEWDTAVGNWGSVPLRTMYEALWNMPPVRGKERLVFSHQ